MPAADMVRDRRSMSESFYLSNMTPQLPAFNRGIWKVLEEKVRDLIRDKGDAYVVTGPLFLTPDSQKTIGMGKVYVPSHFFKIIVTGDRNNSGSLKAVAFVIPNESFAASQLNSFIVTIDQVEEESGFDFFHEIDDVIEDRLESMNRLEI